jgi:hypothetical protein
VVELLCAMMLTSCLRIDPEPPPAAEAEAVATETAAPSEAEVAESRPTPQLAGRAATESSDAN